MIEETKDNQSVERFKLVRNVPTSPAFEGKSGNHGALGQRLLLTGN
jgi:hypothetical protein